MICAVYCLHSAKCRHQSGKMEKSGNLKRGQGKSGKISVFLPEVRLVSYIE